VSGVLQFIWNYVDIVERGVTFCRTQQCIRSLAYVKMLLFVSVAAYSTMTMTPTGDKVNVCICVDSIFGYFRFCNESCTHVRWPICYSPSHCTFAAAVRVLSPVVCKLLTNCIIILTN